LFVTLRIQNKISSNMSFFQSIKNKLGIGGVSISLQVPSQLSKEATHVDGTITLTTKSEQEVKMLTVRMIEIYTTGSGDEKKTKEFELGKVQILGEFVMIPGDLKEISFQLSYAALHSNNDQLKAQGGMLGALGKVAAFASNEKSSYYIIAEADVKAAALDPTDRKEIRLIDGSGR
jgi:hypothetical protein